jgi:nucleosome binding factor SPN SPT16 subunit
MFTVGYCSNVARTFFVTPTKSMERAYALLEEAHDMCIAELRPAKVIGSIVEKVTRYIESKNAKLAKLLTKNFGFGIGLDFRESSMLLTAKNAHVVQVGMVFNVAMGFQNIPLSVSHSDARPKHLPETYSILLADTVSVLDDETKVLTKVSKAWAKIHYDIEDDEDAHGEHASETKAKMTSSSAAASSLKKTPDKKKENDHQHHRQLEKENEENGSGLTVTTRSNILASRLRDQQRALEGKETDQERRDRHQAELMKRKREEAMRRLEQQSSDLVDSKRKDHTVVAYRHASQYPEMKPRQVAVDMRAEAVMVPINGVAVPFHISMIKNVSKNEEDKATYLRINFHCPGVGGTYDII